METGSQETWNISRDIQWSSFYDFFFFAGFTTDEWSDFNT